MKKSTLASIVAGVVLYGGLLGIGGAIRYSSRKNLPGNEIVRYGANSMSYIEDVDGDGVADRTRTLIYGPSFGADLGYSQATEEEKEYFSQQKNAYDKK